METLVGEIFQWIGLPFYINVTPLIDCKGSCCVYLSIFKEIDGDDSYKNLGRIPTKVPFY